VETNVMVPYESLDRSKHSAVRWYY